MTKRTLCLIALAALAAVAGSACNRTPVESTPASSITGTPSPVPLLMARLPTNSTEAPDDIVPTPGSDAYRANVHEQGVPDKWPSIETVETRLVNGSDAIFVRYRNSITTKAGEIRNNLLYIGKENGRFERYSLDLIGLYTVGAPPGMQFLRGAAGALPGAAATVLVIEVSQDAVPGRYDFAIGIEVEGKDYGTLPCTIEVTP